jgi:hypothetical protein
MGDTVGIAPLAILVIVTAVGLLFGAAYVPLAVPFAAMAATLADVLVRGREPATQEVPTVLFGSGELKDYQKDVERKGPEARPQPLTLENRENAVLRFRVVRDPPSSRASPHSRCGLVVPEVTRSVDASRLPQEQPDEGVRRRKGLLTKPILLFFTKRTSGPARRMESLIAHVARKERRRLTVVSVDADENAELAERLSVEEIPTLVLVEGRSTIGRLEGRATSGQIDALINDALA